MKKIVKLVLEVEFDADEDEYCFSSGFIEHDLMRQIACCNNVYDLVAFSVEKENER